MRAMDLLSETSDFEQTVLNDSSTSNFTNGSTTEWLFNDPMPPPFAPSVFFQIIIYTLYTLIFIFALVGNLVVVAVVFASVRKWTVTNFFIVNMAAGDILMAIFCIPFTFVPTFILLYWPFGAVMCRVVSFSQAVSVFVSAYTMVAISSDRYLAIVYPLRPRMTRKQAKITIAVVWLVAALTALPTLLVSELTLPESSDWHVREGLYICQEMWPDRDAQTQYTTSLLLLQFCLPLSVMIFTYGRIGVEIWGKKTPGEAHQNRDLRLARSKRKMIKMMIVVVVFFAFCWLPFNLIQIIGDQYPDIWSWNKINYVFFLCHWLAMSHSAYNPIIYCCFNSKFRQGFQLLALRCGCRCWGPKEDDCVECDCARGGMNNDDVVAGGSSGGGVGGTTRAAGEPASRTSLQRFNTFTTYTCTTGKHNSSCRVLLPGNGNHSHHHHHHGPNCHVNNGGTNHHRLVNQQHPEIITLHRAVGNGSSSRPPSINAIPLPPRPSAAVVVTSPYSSQKSGNSRQSRRPQKFVFRANFSNTRRPSQQQPQLQEEQQQQHHSLLEQGSNSLASEELPIREASADAQTAETHM